jgi:GntR family transcriptional regulator, transcriptional repressor for pyruvate dehydrogenase complex
MLEKIERVKLSEEILSRLKEMIKAGKFGYGDKLPVEKRLAEIFGVSRTTVREAMAVLEAEGWVTTKRGGGSYVKRVQGQDPIEPLNIMMGNSSKGLLELMELRRILEGEVAMMAASRASSEDIAAIRQALRNMSQDIAQGKDTAAADFSFHHCLAKATQNQTILSVISSLHDLYYQTVHTNRWHWAKPNDYGRVLAEHEAIIKAVEKRRGNAAKKAMEIHLENTYRLVEEVLLEQNNDETLPTLS